MIKSLIAALLIACLIAASSVAYRDHKEDQPQEKIKQLSQSLMMLSKRCKSISEIDGKLDKRLFQRCLTLKHPKSFYQP